MSRPCKIKIKQQRRVLIGGQSSRSYEKLMPVILRAAAALATGYSAHPWASPWRAVASDVQICSRQICRSPESLTGVSSSGLTHLPPCRNSNYLGHTIVILRAAVALATGYSAHPWASPWRAVASDVQICSRQICRSPESLIGVSSSGFTHRLAAKLRRSKGYFCSGVFFFFLNRVQMRVS